jgi:hypothetical protein
MRNIEIMLYNLEKVNRRANKGIGVNLGFQKVNRRGRGGQRKGRKVFEVV